MGYLQALNTGKGQSTVISQGKFPALEIRGHYRKGGDEAGLPKVSKGWSKKQDHTDEVIIVRSERMTREIGGKGQRGSQSNRKRTSQSSPTSSKSATRKTTTKGSGKP